MSELKQFAEILESMRAYIDCVEKEAYQKGLDEGKKQGTDDAWNTITKIAKMPSGGREKVFGDTWLSNILNKYSISEIINILDGYEPEQDEIKVGDEVYANTPSGKTQPFIIIKIYDVDDGKYYTGINADGNHVQGGLNYIKTGRHFQQVEELLEAMKGGAE